jgi:hypothetical protein
VVAQRGRDTEDEVVPRFVAEQKLTARVEEL